MSTTATGSRGQNIDKLAARGQTWIAVTADKSQLGVEEVAGRTLIVVGQLSVDTLVLLEREIAIGDQCRGQFLTVPGGTAAIVAFNSAVLGALVEFVGHAGVAAVDESAIDDMVSVGVRFRSLDRSDPGRRVIVLVEPSGERTMVTNHAPAHWGSLNVQFSQSEIVYFEGWDLFDPDHVTSYQRIIHRAADAGAFVVLDVCSATRGSEDTYRQLLRKLPIDLILGNEAEAKAYELFDFTGPSIIVHRGVKPTVIKDSRGIVEVPVDQVVPMDTTGAGDTFAAGFLASLQSGGDLLTAVRAAHAAAREVVQRAGALLAVPSRQSNPVRSEEVIHAGLFPTI